MKRDIIGVYGLSNNASVNVYEIIYGIDDYVVAGINNEEPDEYVIEYEFEGEDDDSRAFFTMGELVIYMDEVMRV